MLTDKAVRAAKAREKPYKIADELGLFLYVAPGGGKLWRMRYQFQNKERLLSFGPFPEVGLADARRNRDDTRAMLRQGTDPAMAKRMQRLANAGNSLIALEAVARDWQRRQAKIWDARHAGGVLRSLERDVFPILGPVSVNDVTVPMVLEVLRRIEKRPALETARRVQQRLSAVFAYAISSGLCATNPASQVAGALTPIVRGRQPALTDLAAARQVLRDAEAASAQPRTKLALRLLALTAVRPNEIHGARWGEFEDLDGAAPLWRIPAARMKMRAEHLVPLAPAAVAVLAAIRPLTGWQDADGLVFPSARSAQRPMSANALGYLLNRSGYHARHVPHGWRATFSTAMNERYPEDRLVIDLMLSHVSARGKVEAAYNRALHLARRRELAALWAGLLLDGFPGPETLLAGPKR